MYGQRLSGILLFRKTGQGKDGGMCTGSFLLIGVVTVVINVLVFVFIDRILRILQIPTEILAMSHEYVIIIFAGIFSCFSIIIMLIF